MGLGDFALGQAKSLAKSKLSGKVGGVVDLAERLYGRYANQIGADKTPQLRPGPRHWWAEASARPDPLLNLFWYCDLPNINGPVSYLKWSYVEEVVLPFVDFDQVSNYRAGKNYHYPNHYNLNTLQCRLYEDSRGTSTEYLYGWQALMLNRETGLYNPPAMFKLPIHITILDVAMLSVMVIEYLGCWPQSIDNFTLTSGNTERINPSVTFSVDEVNINFGKFEADQIPSLMDNIGKGFPASLPKLPTTFPSVFSSVTGMFSR